MHKKGMSNRKIGKLLRHSPKTVGKVLKEKTPRPYHRPKRKTILDDYKDHIRIRFEEVGGISASKLYQEIQPMGYEGSISTIDAFLRTLPEPKTKKEKEGQEENSIASKSQILKKDMGCHIWMHSLLQGEIRVEELEEQLSIDKDAIKKLHYLVLNERLKYRNRALAILAYHNQFPQCSIARFLCIAPGTVQDYVNRFKSDGIEELRDRSRKEQKKFEQSEYIDAVFKVLHAPPSTYDINRTTWRMEDLHHILGQEGFPISKPYIWRIIKDAGYRYLKAKEVLTSNDPQYREKLQEITRILSNLKPNDLIAYTPWI